MTDAEWNISRDPHAMLLAFADNPERSDLILFGCACCRRVWRLLADDRLRSGVEVRERYEVGLASMRELEKAEVNARIARQDVRAAYDPLDTDEQSSASAAGWAAGAAANAAYGNYRAASELAARAVACADVGEWERSYSDEKAAQCELLRSRVAYPRQDQ